MKSKRQHTGSVKVPSAGYGLWCRSGAALALAIWLILGTVSPVSAQSVESAGKTAPRPPGEPGDCPTCRFVGSHAVIGFDKFRSERGTHHFGVAAVLTDAKTVIVSAIFNRTQTAANGITRFNFECTNNGHWVMMSDLAVNPADPSAREVAVSIHMSVGAACRSQNNCAELKAKWFCRYASPVLPVPLLIQSQFAPEEHNFGLDVAHVNHSAYSEDGRLDNHFDVGFRETAHTRWVM